VTTYVILLRGVNVGGRARVSMAALRETCASIGAEDVATYIQSGNVVLRSRLGADTLRDRLADAIGDQLGVRAAVMVRTAAEMAEIIGRNPFPGADPATLHVGFLGGAPADDAAERAMTVGRAPDELQIRGAEVYLHLPNGLGRSKLAAAVIDPRLMGAAVTVRNWRTVSTLSEMSARD
jgi:uncharacterized protein (DUF1697 family)